ncbi:hypothetical protein J6X90_02570 [Candidatus Saccharibacteria bacterium]|nr:hypothetical protein [Candidatus Saccharibacteria bacterium]
MLEELTAREFLETLQDQKVKSLYIGSIVDQNPVVYHATFNEIMRRGEKFAICQLIDKAFESGATFKCNSAIAVAIVASLKSDRTTWHFSYPLVSYLEGNRGTNNVVHPDFYEELMIPWRESVVQKYAEIFTVEDVARMVPATWNFFYDYFKEEAEVKLMIDLSDKVQEHAFMCMREIFSTQTREIALNPNLRAVMNPYIKEQLRIDEMADLISVLKATEKNDEN